MFWDDVKLIPAGIRVRRPGYVYIRHKSEKLRGSCAAFSAVTLVTQHIAYFGAQKTVTWLSERSIDLRSRAGSIASIAASQFSITKTIVICYQKKILIFLIDVLIFSFSSR